MILQRSFILAFTVLSTTLCAQDFSELVGKAWSTSAELRAKDFQLRQAEFALQEAKARYGPIVTFGTQYTLSVGGRAIAFPIGDLLNPVHNTLNSLTQSNQFPTLENQNIQFLPNNFYDARVRIQQPIFYPDLAINRAVKQETIQLQALEIKAYKRLLSKEVMQAYFRWQGVEEALHIFDAADSLLSEARRTTESMIRQGMALPSSLSRLDAEKAAIQAKRAETMGMKNNAKAYLFFLCADTSLLAGHLPTLPNVDLPAGTAREEIAQLDQSIKLYEMGIRRENQFYKPRLGALLDVGSQDFNFGWEPYALFGLNLELNLYDHRRHQSKIDQVRANIHAQEQKKRQVSEQIALAVQISLNNLQAGLAQTESHFTRWQVAQRLYRDVQLKYREGTANYLELIDAQNQITTARLEYNVSRFNVWQVWAEYYYHMAAYPIQ